MGEVSCGVEVMQNGGGRTLPCMDPPDEPAAWRRALAGDGEAFGRLFDAHSGRVFRHARRLTSDRHDAEDVVAAVFLELWRRRRDVRMVNGSVLPWLLVTATNLSLNQRRGRRRYRALVDRLPRHREGGSGDGRLQPEDLDVDPNLVTSIRGLNHVDQKLLALVALEGFPLREAAEAIGLSEQAARSRWQRVRRRLAADYTPDSLSLSPSNH
jgi:RNA polymerase sigma-70 factor (ECF subfamily)